MNFGKGLIICSNFFGFKRGVFVDNATKNILKAIECLISILLIFTNIKMCCKEILAESFLCEFT